MNITHVRLLTVPVSDLDAAKDFYAGKLGLEVVADHQAGPMRWLQVAPAGAQTSVVLADHVPAPGSVHGLMLETADLDADCAKLRAAGVEVDGPQDLPWGRQATLTDPDGNSIVLAAR